MVWDPFALDVEQTPEQIVRCLDDGELTEAIVIAFRLNEDALIMQALEAVPPEDSKCHSLQTLNGYLCKHVT